MADEQPDHPGLTTRFEIASPTDATGTTTGAAGGELSLTGRLVSASNATFLAELSAGGCDPIQTVYKPVAGERPLWDFPDRTLGFREVAAYRVSTLAGFHLVPYTTLVEGPLGPGSLQMWIDDDPLDVVIDLVPTRQVVSCPDSDLVRYADRDWFDVLDGLDGRDQEVTLLHAEDPRLRSMALFDAVINNADRKGGHILSSQGRLFGVDHGISFHPEPKLRTLLWGWAGEEFTDTEAARVQRVLDIADELDALLGEEDTYALKRRCRRLLDGRRFPRPSGRRHTIPWPPW